MTERDPDRKTVGEPWEVVTQSDLPELLDSLHRIKVDGGYLYRSILSTSYGLNQSLCFVPEEKK